MLKKLNLTANLVDAPIMKQLNLVEKILCEIKRGKN
jgi:hypothetical protein